MGSYVIENDYIKATIASHGAEMISLVNKENDKEMMWCGDPAYWGRTSPVLFPFIGKLANLSYRHNGKEYTGVPQHGYARDSEFSLESQQVEEIWFSLKPYGDWLDKYPFQFELRIGYKLEGKKVHVMWTVKNDDNQDMHFSIGAHPAFAANCGDASDPLKGYVLNFYTNKEKIDCGLLNENGVLSDKTVAVSLENGLLKLSNQLFDEDALIISPKGINTISLINPEGHETIKVNFDAPQLGIWSPKKKDAPFVCIEPWFGRCDAENFAGELSEREYGNTLAPGHSFNKEYVIEIV